MNGFVLIFRENVLLWSFFFFPEFQVHDSFINFSRVLLSFCLSLSLPPLSRFFGQVQFSFFNTLFFLGYFFHHFHIFLLPPCSLFAFLHRRRVSPFIYLHTLARFIPSFPLFAQYSQFYFLHLQIGLFHLSANPHPSFSSSRVHLHLPAFLVIVFPCTPLRSVGVQINNEIIKANSVPHLPWHDGLKKMEPKLMCLVSRVRKKGGGTS